MMLPAGSTCIMTPPLYFCQRGKRRGALGWTPLYARLPLGRIRACLPGLNGRFQRCASVPSLAINLTVPGDVRCAMSVYPGETNSRSIPRRPRPRRCKVLCSISSTFAVPVLIGKLMWAGGFESGGLKRLALGLRLGVLVKNMFYSAKTWYIKS